MNTIKSTTPSAIITKGTKGKWPTIEVLFPDPANPPEQICIVITPEKCEEQKVDLRMGEYPRRTRPGISCTSHKEGGAVLVLLFESKEASTSAMALLKSNRDAEMSTGTPWSEFCLVRQAGTAKDQETQFEIYRGTPEGVAIVRHPEGGAGVLLTDFFGARLPTWLLYENIRFVRRFGDFVLFAYTSHGHGVYVILCNDGGTDAALFSKRLRNGSASFLFRPCEVFCFEENDPAEAADEYFIRQQYATADDWPELRNIVGRYWKLFGPRINKLRAQATMPKSGKGGAE